MYCGDEGETTGEDLELERYGLTEGQSSGSGESDTEETLYQQVHYSIGNDDNTQSTTEESTKSNIEMKEYPLTTSRAFPTTNPGHDEKGEMDVNTADVLVASDGDNDDDDDDGYNWKRVESDSKYKANLRITTNHVVANVRSSRMTKAAVIVKDDSESDIIFLDVETKIQESKSPEMVEKEEERNPRKRSWRKTSDDDQTKITKIDRNSWSSARPGSEAQPISSRTSKVVVVADDSSSSSVVVLDSEISEEDASQPKRHPGKDSGEFFLDNKGMALEDVHRDKTSAELGWKTERMKIKAMLKEGVEIINLSSGEEDCMVIESCSEEEGLHVHFDEKGDNISPETNNSGISKGKRKGGESTTPGRYFVQSRQKHIRCHNCNEMGHLKLECPKPLHIPACILCGTRGHTDRSCPDALCFNCSLPGHQSKSCPVKRHIRYARCTRCQMTGHLRKMCPDIWRQYHLTTEHGPIIKPTNQHHRTKQKDVYCSNCSKKGHRYYDCRSARFDEFVVFTYDKVCLYDKKHIGKMVYPAENKNAGYLKLLRERKDEAPSSMTKQDSTNITKDDSQPRRKKQMLPLEERREEEFSVEREEESIRKEQEQSGKNKIPVPNPVKTFVRTRLFGGKKGRSWAKQDEPVMIPSKGQQKETETVSEGGCEKLTKAQKKAQRKALKAQKKQEAKSKRRVNPEDVGQDLAEARRIKHSAALAMNAVKREIKTALMKKKEKAEPVPKPVTDGMTNQQKKALKRKIRFKEREELRLALKEKVKSDAGVRKVDRVFKEARKLYREAKKRKGEVDSEARRAQFVPAERQHSVRENPGYAMSQRGFNLDNRLLEGTYHEDNRWTLPQAGPWDEAFPRSCVPNTNDPTFTNQPYSNHPAFNDGPYSSNTNFVESPCNNSRTLIVSCPNGKRKRRRGKRRKKQGGQGGL